MEIVTTDNAPAAIGPYSQAIKSKGFLFASGQIPVIPASGEIDGNSIETQAERVMAAGSDFQHVVKTTCFLADMNDFAAFNAIYAKYFTGEPARSCVAAKALPKGVLCEVELIAEV